MIVSRYQESVKRFSSVTKKLEIDSAHDLACPTSEECEDTLTGRCIQLERCDGE
jgi:hypothetical protein